MTQPKHYTAEQQREAVQWIMDKAIAPLGLLAARGKISQEELDQHAPALDAVLVTLQYIQQPWVKEALAKGPPT